MLRWFSPLPTPWQRWKDAGGLDKADRDEQCRNDAAVAAAVDYLDALAHCTTDDERAAVQQRWPEIYEARAIFDADNPRRWELEGYVLSGETDEEIAARLGLSPRTVATLRLAVLRCCGISWLSPCGWPTKMFGPDFMLTFETTSFSKFWAWVGICGGPACWRDPLPIFMPPGDRTLRPC